MIVLEAPRALEWIVETAKTLSEGASNPYVLLPDGITEQNLQYSALKKGVNLGKFQLLTLTDFAHELLKRTGTRDNHLLEDEDLDISRAFIRAVITNSVEPELEFLRQLDLDNRDTIKVLRKEFEDYLRATNDAEFHAALEQIARGLKDDFARSVALACLASFFTLRSRLEILVKEQYGEGSLLFRTQLLRLATQAVESSENKALFIGWEIGMAGIPVLDASVVRMLTAIGTREGCTLRIFCTPRLYSSLKKRLEGAGIEFRDEYNANFEAALAPQAKCILGLDKSTKPQLVAAPDRRREVIVLAERISELLSLGAQPAEILVVARDSGAYETLVNSIFPAFGIPVFVQTRQLESLLPQTQMVVSLLRLLDVASRNEPLEWNAVTDPIRLGICLPGGKVGWPMPGPDFVHVEEILSRVQKRQGGRALILDEWISKVPAAGMRPQPRQLLADYLQWVKRSAGSPAAASEAIKVLRDVLDSYIYNRSVWIRKSIDPRVESPARFRLGEVHPTYHAEKIRKSLSDLRDYFEAAARAGLIKSLSWETVLTAFNDVIVNSTFGRKFQDLGSVKVVDAGNTSFVQTKYLFIIGIRADEFPRKHSEGKLLGEELRRAIPSAGKGRASFLFLPSSETDYDVDSDYLVASLVTTSDTVACSMAYLDESGHQVEWSPFVSQLSDEVDIIPPGKWLPSSQPGDLQALCKRSPKWVNWRLFSYYQFTKSLTQDVEGIGGSELAIVAANIDPDFYQRRLEPGIRQYVAPPRSITVKANEEWFGGLTLERIAGPPYTTQELEIHALCPYQFYFYQFLYLRELDKIDRRSIEYWYWMQPWVPRRLADVYPNNQIDKAIARMISILKSRQRDLHALGGIDDLVRLLNNQLRPFEAKKLRSPFSAERSLVEQELGETPPIHRDWEWIQGGGEVGIENSGGDSAKVVLPPHRIDTLHDSKLIVAYVESSRVLKELVYPNEVKGNQMLEWSIQDPIWDYRLATLVSYYSQSSKIAGALFVPLYGEGRKGYYVRNLIPQHKGRGSYDEELAMPLGQNPSSLSQVFSDEGWKRRVEDFADAVVERSSAMTPKESVQYTATPEKDKCSKCVYFSLCHIPRSLGW